MPKYKKQGGDELCTSSDNTCTDEPNLEKQILSPNDKSAFNHHKNNTSNGIGINDHQYQFLKPPDSLSIQSEAPKLANGIIIPETDGPPSLSVPSLTIA